MSLCVKLKENSCFYSWFELPLEAAIAKCFGKYVFLEFNNPINNYLKSKQNPWKIPAEKLIFIKAIGQQPAILLKKWASPSF